MNRTSRILFLVFTILIGFIASCFIILILLIPNSNTKVWIDYPATKIGGKDSENENDYISSFLGSKFFNYSIYQPQGEPDPQDPLSNSQFLGDINNIDNVVNDSTTLNLWQSDVDHTQFVVHIKTDDIQKITLSIDNSEIFDIDYGWSRYIYSTANGKGTLPKSGIWSPDALTLSHELNEPQQGKVHVAWISVYTKDQKFSQANPMVELKTTIDFNDGKDSWSQTNSINVNLINEDYSSLFAENNGIAFLNNDQRLVNFYTKGDVPSGIVDPNDEMAYLKFAWDTYLTKTYKSLLKSHAFDYYSTFFTSVQPNKDHQEATWNYHINDPSLIMWHRKKDTHEIYIPDDEKEAWLFNLAKVKDMGIKNVLLRGFDGVKYYLQSNSLGQYTSNQPNYIFDEDSKSFQVLDLALANRENIKDQYGKTSFDYVNAMLKQVSDMVSDSKFQDLNFYFYFDEIAPKELKEHLKLFKKLKESSPKYNFLKVAYAILYREMDLKDNYLDDIQMIWTHNFNFENLLDSKTWNNFITHREQKGLKTSQYNMEDSFANTTGFEYANNAFWTNFVGLIRTPGYLNYALTSWDANSMWTDQFAGIDSGELMYIYPSDNLNTYPIAKSPRLEMLVFGYNMYLKYQVLKDRGLNVANYFKNYEYLKINRIDYQFSKNLRYNFNQSLTEKTYPFTKSPFLNWIIKNLNHEPNVSRKLLINYTIVNMIGVN